MSVPNLNVSRDSFKDIIEKGMTYSVPSFQRDYSWTEEHWNDLWQDIVGVSGQESEQYHYMGFLVLKYSDSEHFEIIDGQQRITTITILILAAMKHIRDLHKKGIDENNNKDRENTLRNNYILYKSLTSLRETPRLRLNRHNNLYFRDYLIELDPNRLHRLNASDRKLKKAFNWFSSAVKDFFESKEQSGKRITDFILRMCSRLYFSTITVTDELNAFKVFETLNARGVKLSSTDLLKNYLFSIAQLDADEGMIKDLEDRWEKIVSTLEADNLPEFLRFYWNSQNKLVRNNDLFRVIRHNITNTDQAKRLIKSMVAQSDVYAGMRNPKEDERWDKQERDYFDQLRTFSVRQPLSLLLAAYREFFDEDRRTFCKILKAIWVLSFRYNVICNLQTPEQERLYNEIALKISNKKLRTYGEIKKLILKLYPSEEVFMEAFSKKEINTKNGRNKRVVRLILAAIEKEISGNILDLESPEFNIEHIYPENPSNEWESSSEMSNLQDYTFKLGNMTLIESKSNKVIGSKGFNKKIEAYRESSVRSTSDIAESYDEWDEDNIYSRQKTLAQHAVKIWKID